MSMIKLDPQLAERLQANPGAEVRLIVRVTGDLAARAAEVERRGARVYRCLPIIGALALAATGRQALALAAEPWVERVEEDREVRAAGGEH